MSPSALSSGMLIVVEEMVLLAARPVVLATKLKIFLALPRAQVQRTGSCGYATCHPTRQQLPDTVGMRLTASNPPAGALAPSETAPVGHRSPLAYKLPLLELELADFLD